MVETFDQTPPALRTVEQNERGQEIVYEDKACLSIHAIRNTHALLSGKPIPYDIRHVDGTAEKNITPKRSGHSQRAYGFREAAK